MTYATPLQYFVLLFPEALVSKLSSETHAQAASLAPQPPGLKEFPQVDGRGRQEDTDDEPEVFAVISLHRIVLVARRGLLRIRAPYLRRIVTGERCLLLLQRLFFVNDSPVSTGQSKAQISLQKIRPVFNFLVNKFLTVFAPSQHCMQSPSH